MHHPAPDGTLLHAWLEARSLARGLPAPVADRGGYRVDTGAAEETARWVFAAVTPGLVALGREIEMPRLALKLCARADRLVAALPARWRIQAPGWFMAAGPTWRQGRLPPGYRCEVGRDGARVVVLIRAADGTTAASGYAAETASAFVYDRIVVAPDHRRRGLGRMLMTALRRTRAQPGVPELLTATADGRALYASLGWRVLSDLSTALLPPPGEGTPGLASGPDAAIAGR